MLTHTDAPLAEVAAQGKKFKWNRPTCSCGREKVWGHGFVSRHFVGQSEAVYLKRYRCPGCMRVFTMIPGGYGRRYQSPMVTIFRAIYERLTRLLWPAGVTRQRGGHWLRKFLNICRMDFPEEEPLRVLDRLRGNGIHFFSRS